MPLSPRQERFCQAFVLYGTAAAAAAEAGYTPRSAKKQGWRLLRSSRIQTRIRDIRAELAGHNNTADAEVLGKLEVVYRRALAAEQFHAAARAVQLQAQIMRGGQRARMHPSAMTAPAAKTQGATEPLAPKGPRSCAMSDPNRRAPVGGA